MNRTTNDRSRYDGLRQGRRTLGLLAPLVQLSFMALGFGIFLDQSRSLLSDAQFTWGERQVMGIIALLALGGCGFAGWVVGRLIKVAAELLEVLADNAEAAWRTSDLIERHVIPTLARVASALERMESTRDRNTQESSIDMSRNPGEPRRAARARARVIPETGPSVFVPGPDQPQRPPHRWRWLALGFIGIVAIGAVGVMVAWPRLNPRKLDPVERVAESYLKALASNEPDSARRYGIVEEPPAIRSFGNVQRQRGGARLLRGSFAPLGEFHGRIDAEFAYDASIGRFTPKNAMGPAAETLDALHAAKDDAEKSGLYKKMESGNPDDLFDAAEQFGKVFDKLAKGVLAPKRILPTYQMLVDEAKPPLPEHALALAREVAGSQKNWDALLKRPFHSLKADGPFIFERAEVTATATDRLASLGDPPSRLRLVLTRFQLEGIDTGWKVISARRVLPGEVEKVTKPAASPSKALSKSKPTSPGDVPESR